MNQGDLVIIAIFAIDHTPGRNFPHGLDVFLKKGSVVHYLISQPVQIGGAPGDDGQRDNLRHRITVQLPHSFFYRAEQIFARLDDQQLFIALFDLALPAIDRAHRLDAVNARGEFLADQGLRQLLGFLGRAGSDVNDNEIIH
jgi:hypothetical protein